MLDLLTFATINLLGAMSPGADFAIVAHYGLKGSRRKALFATLGIGMALVIHALYCMFGLGLVLHNSPQAFLVVQLSGAVYLAYLGIKIFKNADTSAQSAAIAVSGTKAFSSGFFTNLLNPKAALFMLGIFTQFMSPTTSTMTKIIYGLTVPCIAIAWFSCLSYLITHPLFLPKLHRYQHIFIKTMGLLLLAVSFSILYAAL